MWLKISVKNDENKKIYNYSSTYVPLSELLEISLIEFTKAACALDHVIGSETEEIKDFSIYFKEPELGIVLVRYESTGEGFNLEIEELGEQRYPDNEDGVAAHEIFLTK